MSERGDARPRGRAELATALRARLEIERSFGWTPPIRPQAPPPPAPAAIAPRTSSVGDPAAAAREARSVGAGAVPPVAEGPGDGGSPAAPRRPMDRSPAERARREELLRPIRAEVAACERCPLGAGRTNTVFGVGDPCARLMFVGEGPGFDEDRLGEPFVGKAGQLLDKIIAAMKLARDDVYIANVVKCRPPQNRNPEPPEIASCLPYLRRQIEIVAPDVICALGGVASKTLLDRPESVGRLRGRFHDFDGIPLRVTYHPAYLLRSPADKRKTWEDVQAVMDLLGIER